LGFSTNSNVEVGNTYWRLVLAFPICVCLLRSIFLILFSQRMLGIETSYYSIPITLFFILMLTVIITSTILDVLKIEDSAGHIDRFNNIFNSPGSRNFLAIISFLLFVIFVYEVPEYNNSQPHHLIDKIFFGHNNFISNRLVGILLVVIFGLFTGYTVYVTTRDIST
jgi:hypothetical protein